MLGETDRSTLLDTGRGGMSGSRVTPCSAALSARLGRGGIVGGAGADIMKKRAKENRRELEAVSIWLKPYVHSC